jgi:hypothetical protein
MDGSEVPDIRLAEGAALLFECAASPPVTSPPNFAKPCRLCKLRGAAGRAQRLREARPLQSGQTRTPWRSYRVFLRVLGWAQPGGASFPDFP